MDPLAQLALMTKAKLLFESEDTFLSFPALTPISYGADQMDFANASTSQQLHAFADFSTWTNALPQGTIFQPTLTELLWDVYQGVLENAQVAEGALTADQTTALEAAQSYLVTQDSNGIAVDTPAVVAYKQYQQAYFAANQAYNNQKVTASTSSDPGVLSAWQNGGQAAAQAALQSAESDWENKGFKAQVEQAQLVVQTLGTQSPQLKWASWLALCNPAVDFLTDPSSNSTFGPTLFAPSDIVNQQNWPNFSIVGADIPNLVAQAPAELKAIFGNSSGTSTVNSLSFDYCSVALSRPWFSPEIFSARFWRFSDATVGLSDGNTPPTGSWPAYVCAVVFARNITVTTTAVGPSPGPTQALENFPPVPATLVKTQLPSPQPRPVFLRPAMEVNQPATVSAPSLAVTHAAVAPQRMMIARSSAVPAQAANLRAAQIATPFHASSPAQTAEVITINPLLRARLNAATFVASSGQTASTKQPQPPPGPTQSVSSGVSVLAFICKGLPKCPNPDPSLNWG